MFAVNKIFCMILTLTTEKIKFTNLTEPQICLYMVNAGIAILDKERTIY